MYEENWDDEESESTLALKLQNSLSLEENKKETFRPLNNLSSYNNEPLKNSFRHNQATKLEQTKSYDRNPDDQFSSKDRDNGNANGVKEEELEDTYCIKENHLYYSSKDKLNNYESKIAFNSNDKLLDYSSNSASYNNNNVNDGNEDEDTAAQEVEYISQKSKYNPRFNENYQSSNDYRTKYDKNSNDDGQFVRLPPYIPPTLSNNDQDIFAQTISEGIDFDKYKNIKVQISGGDGTQQTVNKFDAFSEIHHSILVNVNRCNYHNPTPIQKFAIPVISNGIFDLMGCAQTGSGKTAAFLIPTFSYLLNNNLLTKDSTLPSPHILVIGPTRELVSQIWTEMRKFSYSTPIRTGVAYGGVALKYIMSNMRNGCDSLVATPGRLIELVQRGLVSLKNVKFLILDEADRMLDMGFISDIRRVIYDHGMPSSEYCRCYMFSATFPVEIQKLAGEILAKDYFFLRVGIVGGAADSIIQEIINVAHHEKRSHLMEIISKRESQKILIFVETKRSADFLATFLSQNEVNATSIHGDRTQEQREKALDCFKKGINPVLIATSVAARGLDIPCVDLVVNFDLPNEIDDYVHRIGRTGRLGNKGSAISFFTPGKDDSLSSPLLVILKNAKQKIPEFLDNNDYSSGGASRRFVNSKDERKIPRKMVNAYVSHQDRASNNSYHEDAAVIEEEDEKWE